MPCPVRTREEAPGDIPGSAEAAIDPPGRYGVPSAGVNRESKEVESGRR